MYLFLEVLLLKKFLKFKGMKICLMLCLLIFLSSCGTNNKIVGQRFELQQHNEKIGSIYFSADYAQIKGIEKGTSKYFVDKVGSKRYLFIEYIPDNVLNCKPDFWKTLKYKKDNIPYYVYLIENLDDEVFHLSALQDNNHKPIDNVDDVSTMGKSPHQNDRMTLKSNNNN